MQSLWSFILSFYIIESILPSSKLCFIFAFRVQVWLLHFELGDCYTSFLVVVQVSSFNNHCCNSNMKRCCYIQTSMNDVFWISPIHAHQFFLLIFFVFDVVFVFIKLFTWAPMFFHISCAIIIPKLVEV